MAVSEGQVLARLDDANVRAALRAGGGAGRGGAAGRGGKRGAAGRGPASTLGRRMQLVTDGVVTAGGRRPGAGRGRLARRRAWRPPRAAGAWSPSARSSVQQHRARQHDHPRAVHRRGDLEGRAARRDGLARVGRRRLHPHRHLHDRRHGVARDRGGRQRGVHQPRDAGPGGDGGARCLSRLADSRARHHAWCRPPIARRRPCWCGSASRSSTRGSCPTWASR